MSIIESVNTLFLNTGNLLSLESFKRKVILVPSGEVIEGINATLSFWKTLSDDEKAKKIKGDGLIVQNSSLPIKISHDVDRKDLNIYVKLFTYSDSCKAFTEALNHVMTELEIESIDTLTISPPPSQTMASIEHMKPIWNCAVRNVNLGKVKELGVSDLNTEQLKELYAWAEEAKPVSNQINLDACCVIPPDMNEFAKEKEIRLLTHNDSKDFLPSDKVEEMLVQNGLEPNKWLRVWVARYTAIVIGKGIVNTKGYMIAFVRK
ncbi:Glutamate--cysteine ligase regulatory subunit [Halotydeus destructor]|nr:Glutamate--cysteine ligase regulatory subunit [Halotydeus destructor]